MKKIKVKLPKHLYFLKNEIFKILDDQGVDTARAIIGRMSTLDSINDETFKRTDIFLESHYNGVYN